MPPAPTHGHGRRRLFLVATFLQLAIVGTAYAFPLWLIQYKRMFDISQVQANVIGIALYLSVSFLGVPLSPVVLPLLSPTTAILLCSSLSGTGFGFLWLISRGTAGHGDGAFVMLILGIVFVLGSLGVIYTLTYAILIREDMYGMENIVFVNGAMNTAFAAGGVASGCLFYFTGLGLEGNMLLIFLVQLFSIPLVTVGVYLSAGSGVCLCTSEASEQDGDDDDDDARMGNAGVEESTPLIGKTGEDTAINADARPDEPEGLKEFLRVTLSSWRYYHTIIIILLKVGIGSTFTTNIGAATAATQPEDASEDQVDKKVSFVIIWLNFGQLVGRMLFTLLNRIPANPNVVTICSVMFIAAAYTAIFAVRVIIDFTYENILIVTTAFGVVYGLMWCTTSALLPFVPLSQNVPRVLAMTHPWGGVGNIVLNSLAGLFYDSHATHGNLCYGKHCYYESDHVMMAVSGGLFVMAALRLFLGVPEPNGRWKDGQSC